MLGWVAAVISISSCRDGGDLASILLSATLRDKTALLHADLRYSGVNPTGKVTYVSYRLNEIGFFDTYQQALKSEGWTKIRDLLWTEKDKCGGNSGGLYQRAGRKMLMNICGSSLTSYSRTTHDYEVLFKLFDGLTPEEVLGRKFRQNPVPPPDPRRRSRPTLLDGLFGD